jgi:hypothetical protein
MRFVTNEARIRELADGESDEVTVLDTTELNLGNPVDLAILRDLGTRLVEEGQGDLYGRLYDEHPQVAGDDEEEIQEAVATDGDEEEDAGYPEQGGLVSVKQIYPADSEFHGLPSLEGPVGSWLATADQDLAGMGIDANSEVAQVQLWRPQHPNTHYEVGAVMGGRYAKFDLTAEGYRMIYNATPPTAGDYYQAAVAFATAVNARELYAAFLQVAQDRGPFNMETNDCEAFAGFLCGAVSGAWDQ